MRRILIAFLFLCVALAASAQKKENFFTDLNDFLDMRANKSYARMDSTYIGRYPNRWDARLFYKSWGQHVLFNGTESWNLTSGMRHRLGLGLSYRGIGLSYSWALQKEAFSVDLSFDSYGKHFCFEYAFRGTNELSGSVSLPGGEDIDTEKNPLVLFSNNLNLFYSFNPRFSYAAAMKQTQIQKRSAGSLIAGVSWSVWAIMSLNGDIADITVRELVNNFYKANTLYNRISIGAGYGYNLVLGQSKWLLHASLVPMWSVFETIGNRKGTDRKVTRYPYGWVSFTGTARAGIYYRWGTRWSIGFSGVINQMLSKNTLKSQGNNYPRVGAQEWQMRLSFAFRFD